MIDIEKLRPVLAGYKAYLPSHWEDEKYKWENILHFQKYWNLEAPDFSEMFKTATDKTANLLASGYAYPRQMIIRFAMADGEAVRQMFRKLFDESKDLTERVEAFQAASEEMRVKYDDGTWKNHYQNTNAISTYLWLKFPDKYYIYKYELYRNAAMELNAQYRPKRNGNVASMIQGFEMYDTIRSSIQKDEELIALYRQMLTGDCYADPYCNTLTIDVGFYLSRFYLQAKKTAAEQKEWYPRDYDPAISAENWVELLNDPAVFTPNALRIMKRMKDYGGQATCTQLAIKYGENANFYNSGSSALARRVAEKTNCPLSVRDNETTQWWAILFTGKDAGASEQGSFVWRLREALSKALDKVDLSDVPLYAERKPAFWKISEGTDSTGISSANKAIFRARNAVAVHSKTKAMATMKVSQGQDFAENIQKGDYFYLCYGSSIQLLGQFTGDKAVPCPELEDGWVERSYRMIAEPVKADAYTGAKKWWTPNYNSTCIRVEESDWLQLNEWILMPYFGKTVEELMNGTGEPRRYWWLTANPKIWSFSNLAIGDEQSYTLYNENGNKRRVFQNFLDVQVGDVVVGYEAYPVKRVVGLAEITQASDGSKIFFAKTEGLVHPIDYADLKACPELEKMEYFVQPNGSLFKLTEGEYDFIMDMIREENPLWTSSPALPKYTKEDFLSKVYMDKDRFEVLQALLRNKKNIILQGAPGVGKTFAAKKLAYAMMGEQDDSRIELVQFHQNYSYEDFIMGYRPDGAGFKLTEGIFYRFCQTAANHPDKAYFFIIDEINRGNMSKIFGELMMLIEKGYRGTKAVLAYSGLPFAVPENLYIIGMMNTADRSLAMIDYALRRRFSFFEMEPAFDSVGFQEYQKALADETFNALIDQIMRLNREITEDASLGKGFRIGHSYFCGREELGCDSDWLHSVVEFDILPMLAEYWFDDPAKLKVWEQNLNGVFNDA